MKSLSDNLNPVVFLDIAINDDKIGRVAIELFQNKVPKTAENFRALCTGEKGLGVSGKPLHYKGTIFHKIVPHLMVLGGDIVNFNGTDGESIYGPRFGDENLERRHDVEGLLSTVNEGKPNTNSSQFVITLSCCPQLNGTNVVFGKVLKGLGTIQELSHVALVDDRPVDKVSICDCGELSKCDSDWGLEECDGTEDVYTPHPEDWDYSTQTKKLNHAFVAGVVNKIKTVGNVYYAGKNYNRAERKYLKALRYYDWMMKVDDETSNKEELEDLKIAMLLNLAAVKLHQSKFRQALNYCDEVLGMDRHNSKALFRRAQAHIGMNEYQLGLADLEVANEESPNNKDIQKEIERVKTKMKSYFLRERETCKRMFKS